MLRFASYKLAFCSVLIPLLIRAIPEILSGPYPVGWDIIAYYIPNSLDMASGTMNIWGVITSPPLMYAFVVPFYIQSIASPVMIFKIMGPVLYGLLGWSIFRFCKARLHWSGKKAFYAVLFISAYFVSLRIAWDAYEAELGLALLLLGESIVGNKGSIRSLAGKISLLSLAVLSNQLVGVLVVGGQLASLLRLSSWVRPKVASLQFLPVALFGLVVYASMQTPLGPGLAVLGPGVGLSSLLDSSMFLVYAYILVVPLLLLGLGLPERSVFSSWVIACLGGLLLALLPGHVFQDIGYRWALLLAIPVLIIAYEGFSKLNATVALRGGNWSTLLRVSVILGLAGSATLFVALPAQSAFPFYNAFPQYLPSSMIQSSLPSSDYANVVNAMVWLNGHTNSSSAVIAQQSFYGWARMYLSSGTTILNCYLSSPTAMLTQAGSYDHVYTVWWDKGTGWFQSSFPTGAAPVASFGDLVVYQYR